jgi:4-hydroxy-2-oxoheptanedioate aldolase
MDLPRNAFKRALAAGKPQIGLWSSLSSNYTVEVIAGAGFDWILLDSEHSPNDLENLLTQLQAAAPYPTHPVVRVPWNDMVNMKRVLDIGAQSLLIPYVQNAEEAREAVAHTRYRASAGSRTTPSSRTRRSVSWCRSKPSRRSTISRRSVE